MKILQSLDEKKNDIIVGRNSVKEALLSDRDIDSIFISKGEKSGAILNIIKIAKERNIIIKEVDIKKLELLSEGASHQGIIARVAFHEYSTVEDILNSAENRGEPPFIIIASEIEDPHNLGAIIRTAECVGAHGVIIPKRRAVGLTYAVNKVSSGAVEYMPVARVTNLATTIDSLKEKDIWVYCADMDGQSWCRADLTGATALVIGSEGKGVGRLIKSKCDGVLSLPIKGKINSLNASVAGGVLMYEILRQRMGN